MFSFVIEIIINGIALIFDMAEIDIIPQSLCVSLLQKFVYILC